MDSTASEKLCVFCGQEGADARVRGIDAHHRCVLEGKLPLNDARFSLVKKCPLLEYDWNMQLHLRAVILDPTMVSVFRKSLKSLCRYVIDIGMRFSAHLLCEEEGSKRRAIFEQACAILDELFEIIQLVAENYLLGRFDTLRLRATLGTHQRIGF